MSEASATVTSEPSWWDEPTPAEDHAHPPTTHPIDGLRRIAPDDVTGLAMMLQNIWRVREVWTDDALENPGLWFMNHYTNPANLIFDIEMGSGFIAFLHTVPGWYSNAYLGAWGKRAYRRHDLWVAAAQVAMLTHDLLVINAFILPTNKIARRLATKCGMREMGLIRNGASYAGAPSPWVWYVLDRATLGLDPITE